MLTWNWEHSTVLSSEYQTNFFTGLTHPNKKLSKDCTDHKNCIGFFEIVKVVKIHLHFDFCIIDAKEEAEKLVPLIQFKKKVNHD